MYLGDDNDSFVDCPYGRESERHEADVIEDKVLSKARFHDVLFGISGEGLCVRVSIPTTSGRSWLRCIVHGEWLKGQEESFEEPDSERNHDVNERGEPLFWGRRHHEWLGNVIHLRHFYTASQH